MKQKMIPITFSLPEKMFDRLNELTSKRDFLSRAECLRWMITEMCNKHLDNYIEVAKKRLERKPMTPEELAQREIEKEEAKELAKQEKKRLFATGICDQLEGKVEDRDGVLYCVFNNYEQTGPDEYTAYPQAQPFEFMNTEMPSFQYRTRMGETGEKAKEIIKKLKIKQ